MSGESLRFKSAWVYISDQYIQEYHKEFIIGRRKSFFRKEILKNKELSSRRGLRKSRLELQTGFLTTVLQFNQCLYCPYFPAAGGCSWNNEITIQQFFNGGKMHRLREGDRV